MSENNKNFDVVVVGAGTAGSAAAFNLASQGFHVALIESRPLEKAGPDWFNAVPPWMFDEAGIDRPKGPEKHHGSKPVVSLARADGVKARLKKSPLWHLNISMLTARLHQLCRKSGVEIFDNTTAGKLFFVSGRPSSLSLTPTGGVGREFTVSARLFVDAAGMTGVLRHQSGVLGPYCPPVPRKHICLATQQVCRINDKGLAQEYFHRSGCNTNDSINWMGVNGGFSTIAIGANDDLSTVDLLAGAISGIGSGAELLAGLKQKENWIGEPVVGGGAPIPIRRPYDILTAEGLALVGDSACQVFPAHGSGTGIGMIAAKILADSVAGTKDPGDPEALWNYQSKFMREYGSTFAAFDVFRRAIQPLDREQISSVFDSGMVSENLFHAALNQKLPSLKFKNLVAPIRALRSAPEICRKIYPQFAKMPLVYSFYRRYPREPDIKKLRRWSKGVAMFFGEVSDIY